MRLHAAIIVRMVTYCTGSARQKRAYFEDADGVVVLDNIEVLFCASENGRNYFAYGKVPFSDFTVADYLAYRRALCGECVSTATMRAFGLKPHKRLGRLSPAEMRCVTFLEKTAGHTEKSLVINLDGTKYTRRDAACLKKLIAAVHDAYVCVTDPEFIDSGVKPAELLSFGRIDADAPAPEFYSARLLAKRIGAKKVAVF